MLFRSQASFISELDAWRLANLGTASAEGTAADDANPSGDGITNLEKFAFGLDPGVASRRRVEISGSTLVARGLPVVSQGWQGDAERRVLRFVRRTGNAAEASTPLASKPRNCGQSASAPNISPAIPNTRALVRQRAA